MIGSECVPDETQCQDSIPNAVCAPSQTAAVTTDAIYTCQCASPFQHYDVDMNECTPVPATSTCKCICSTDNDFKFFISFKAL